MSRSDSSIAPRSSAMSLGFRGSQEGIGPPGTVEVSLGHARLCSLHPSATHVTGSCAGLRLLRQARPPVPPKRVHFRSGLEFVSDPSPAPSRETAVFPYGGCCCCTGPSGGI
jgi:hypothetical protein